jgi:hypothetical protein
LCALIDATSQIFENGDGRCKIGDGRWGMHSGECGYGGGAAGPPEMGDGGAA